MRRHVKRVRTAVTALASAVVVTAGTTVGTTAGAAVGTTAGLTRPASAISERAPGETPVGGPDARGAGGRVSHRITLVTGDRVLVDDGGRVLGLERAKGREDMPVQVRTAHGHTYVLPADAARLIAGGRVDKRLFDITVLNRSATRTSQKQGLTLIVGYAGPAAGARADVRDAGGTKVRRTLKTLNADAVLTPRDDAAELWKAVTDTDGTTATGVAHLWLDGVRKVALDTSVARIGAPKAWKAGFDGKGVTIDVLDTDVDATHPGLKGQVAVAKNFSTSPDTTDKYGHGTHVASIAAGTGARSKGRYKGVAPGAELLNGKVLSDEGFGDDSGIIAGMEWAAEQGADVVNLSLGGGDTPEVDPMEAMINKLSAEKGILFAVPAGNEGDGERTVGSPGGAAAALTVGAVDDKDRIALFSSRGPGMDGQIKPDVTAPGVGITAAAAPGSVIDEEVGQKPEGYLTISGTSMATPHVAGAAALLTWKKGELSSVRTGLGSSAAGKTGAVIPWAWLPGSSGSPAVAVPQPLPGTRTLHLSAVHGVKWSLDFEQYGAEDEQGFPLLDAYYTTGDSLTLSRPAGRTHRPSTSGSSAPRSPGSTASAATGTRSTGCCRCSPTGAGTPGPPSTRRSRRSSTGAARRSPPVRTRWTGRVSSRSRRALPPTV